MSIGRQLQGMLLQAAGNAISRGLRSSPAPQQTDPMEGWAMGQELAPYAYDPRSVYFGNIHQDHGQNFAAGLPSGDDRHMFIVAGNGAGKGTSFLVQNCIRWQGGVVVIDPKGEAAGITAMRRGSAQAAKGTGTSVRQFLGQKVAILDPFNVVQGAAKCYRVGYNPLRDIDITKNGWGRQIRLLSDAAVMRESEGAGAHFSESIAIIMRGVIEKILHTYPTKKQTLVAVNAAMWQPFEDFKEWMLEAPKTAPNLAHMAATSMEEIGAEEWGAMRTTMARKLAWLADEDLQRHLRHSDFSLRDVVQSGGSVYIVVDPESMSGVKEWMRVIVRQAIGAKVAMGDKQTGLQTFFMLDEFPLLGHFEVIEESAGYLRGFGAKLMPIIQNIGQVKKHYANNWETFLGNAGAIVAWGTNDSETEEYLAKRLGSKWAWEETYGESQNHGLEGGGGMNRNMGKQQRPLLFPNEVHNLGARETGRAFILPAAGKPFMVERQPYFSALDGQGLFDSPQFIREWERRHGKGGA